MRAPGAGDLDDPIDDAVLGAMVRQVWSANGWKVLVVTPDAAGIARAIREENPTPPVYAAASTETSDGSATDPLFR